MSPVLAAEATPKGSPLWAFVFSDPNQVFSKLFKGMARSPVPVDFDQLIFFAVCHTANT